MAKLITNVNDKEFQNALSMIAKSTGNVHAKLGKDSPQFETYLYGVSHGVWATMTDTNTVTTAEIYDKLRLSL